MLTMGPNCKSKTPVIEIKGRNFILDRKPFYFQGLSFFNALFNPTFNQSKDIRMKWLKKFQSYGIMVLRIWGQWDCSDEKFVDSGSEQSLYRKDARLRPEVLERLTTLLEQAGEIGMVVELTTFSPESKTRFSLPLQDKALISVAHTLLPYRNLFIQIWNENSEAVDRHYRTIKTVDPDRLVTNCPGWAGEMGDHQRNLLLDFLTPHTSRDAEAFWKVAPREIEALIRQFDKPVVDDEPARTGISLHGGIPDSSPEQHISQIRAVRQAGGHHTYHHDMFQSGYGDPATPPSGIPDPDFSNFHVQVFNFLREQKP